MADGEDADMVAGPDQAQPEQTGFELPFNVATFQDVAQRAYFEDGHEPEWLFSRVHSYVGAKTEAGRMLRNNKAAIQQELEELQVPSSEFHYRGQQPEQEATSSTDTKDPKKD